ncbi:SDR family oxidoreductase [Nonomuraea maheshkhaliensis]|uniref:SDR family oxidoreductase n=1 Tax=Nonomuraea maheshkhaliensis TaxID=419590 RepID=A0ABN2ESP7_9ACTN
MDLHLTGKRAIVAGASRGIGLEVVRRLYHEGVRVLAVSRSASPEVKDSGAFLVQADLTHPDGVAALVRQAEIHLGHVDFLVNCVGGVQFGARKDDLQVTPEQWRTTFEVNVVTAFEIVTKILPLMRTRGAIVHIAGLAAHMPGAGPIDNSASKAALIAMTRSIAFHASRYGVRSNSISPGPVATSMWEDIAAMNGVTLEEFFERLPKTLRMRTGQMVAPTEVAALTAFMLSPYAASITGADYEMSGGLRP